MEQIDKIFDDYQKATDKNIEELMAGVRLDMNKVSVAGSIVSGVFAIILITWFYCSFVLVQ